MEANSDTQELILGNSFGVSVLDSFGYVLWMSIGAINVEAFGIIIAYGNELQKLTNEFSLNFFSWKVF